MADTLAATKEILLDAPFDDIGHQWKKLFAQTPVKLHRELTRWLAKNDRWFLFVEILNRKDAIHPWVYARCREVERSPDGHLDLWARGHFKSSLITQAGIIQEIINDQDITICIFSHTRPIAKGFLRQIKRELEANEKLKGLFPEIFWSKPKGEAPVWSEDSGLIVKRTANPKEATLEAYGLVDGQPISRHYGLLVYDDVVTLASVYTAEMIQKTTEGWELSLNLCDTSHFRAWYIGTRYSYADTYRDMMERDAAKPRLYPGTADGTFTGTPVYLTEAMMAKKLKEQGKSTFACQILQNPIAGSDATFRIEWLSYWEIRPMWLNVYILCDPASSKRKTSDRSAFLVVGVDYNRNKYLLDGYLHRMNLSERWKHLLNLRQKWIAVYGVQTLKVGYEKFGGHSDIEYFEEQMETSGRHFPIEELAWPHEGPGSKTDRIQRLQPDLESGRIFLPWKRGPTRRMLEVPKGQRGREIMRVDENKKMYSLGARIEEELLLFPVGNRDDGLDAFSRLYDIEYTVPRPPGTGADFEPEVVADY